MQGHNLSITGANSTHKEEDENEAYYLFLMATSGIFFNGIVILMCFARKCLRKLTSAFIIHGSVLDMIKCAYCIPFAMSILTHKPPDFCQLLGGSYVILISASVFNLVAMVCTEAYVFGEETFGRSGGSTCCVIFGIMMIYCGSIILHLGPTIVGGSFDFNKILSQCIFIYGEVRSYVVYVMWVMVTTLSIFVVCHYIWVLYRNISAQKKQTQTTMVLDPAVVMDAAEITYQEHPSQVAVDSDRVIADAYSRVRCFIIMTATFVLNWYPLFIATLVDPKFKLNPMVYIILTILAWSNGAINPMIYLLTDNQFNLIKNFLTRPCSKKETAIPLMRHDVAMFERVGCRLCQEGRTHSARLCNGRSGNGRLVRQNSICQIHQHQSEWHV